MTDTERLAFEKWAKTVDLKHERLTNGHYDDVITAYTWAAYKAGWQARAQDSRCGELLEASKNVNAWIEITGYATGPMKERLTKAIAAFEASHEK